MNCLAPIRLGGLDFPCRKCVPCLAQRRLHLSFRISETARHANTAIFSTLTYSPEYAVHHLGDKSTTLVKKHIRDFHEALRTDNRRRWKGKNHPKLKYLTCGEYGSKTNRAHYHSIILNAHQDTINQMQNGKIWYRGHQHIGNVTEQSIMYVSKYSMDAAAKGYSVWGQRPFSIMSKGLGSEYLTEAMLFRHKPDDDPFNWITYCERNGIKISMPMYYKKKIWPTTEERILLGEQIYGPIEEKMVADVTELMKVFENAEKAMQFYLEDCYQKLYRQSETKLKRSLQLNSL